MEAFKKVWKKICSLFKERPEPKWEPPPIPKRYAIPPKRSLQEVKEQLETLREEEVRKQYFPKPKKVYRRRTHNRPPPAERHRAAISRYMKGKSRTAPWYRKQIKGSKNIKIEDEDEK